MCCIQKLRYQPEDDFRLAEEGAKIMKEERDKKEGKTGEAPKSFKDSLFNGFKSVSSRFSKISSPDNDEDEHEHDKQAAKLATTAPPPTAAASGASTRKIKSDVELLPSSSKFSKYNETPARESSVEVSSTTSASSTRYSSSREKYDDLLPPTSRFATKPVSSTLPSSTTASAPTGSAVITPDGANVSSGAKKSSKLGWFGGKAGHGDEDGLLPKGFRRSDSNV